MRLRILFRNGDVLLTHGTLRYTDESMVGYVRDGLVYWQNGVLRVWQDA